MDASTRGKRTIITLFAHDASVRAMWHVVDRKVQVERCDLNLLQNIEDEQMHYEDRTSNHYRIALTTDCASCTPFTLLIKRYFIESRMHRTRVCVFSRYDVI